MLTVATNAYFLPYTIWVIVVVANVRIRTVNHVFRVRRIEMRRTATGTGRCQTATSGTAPAATARAWTHTGRREHPPSAAGWRAARPGLAAGHWRSPPASAPRMLAHSRRSHENLAP